MGDPDEPPLLDRIHSWAKTHATNRISFAGQESSSSLPTYNNNNSSSNNAAPRPGSRSPTNTTTTSGSIVNATDAASDEPEIKPSASAPASSEPPPAPPPGNSEKARNESSTLGPGAKPPWSSRLKGGSGRFIHHTKDAVTHSWINVLLVFVPIGIALNWVPMPHDTKATVVFAMNAVAIIPLAGLLSHATESVASRMGDTWASLLNVTFGNAVELIIFIIALAKNEIRIVQASILGSILANLLLILGMAFVLGGLRFREQIYNSTVTQMSACLLSLSVVSLLLPTAFHASFADNQEADDKTTRISRGTSVVLLLVYFLYLAFQLKSHAYLYESTPQHIVDEESHPGILADLMNSSSDSSSSSSDGDSDSSDSSVTTARKIRRVLKHGRRRKSSASSVVTTAAASVASSPGSSRRKDSDRSHHGDAYASNANDAHPGILSGDEADVDGETGPPANSRVRDFSVSGEMPAGFPERKLSRKEKQRERKKQQRHERHQRHEARRAKKENAAAVVVPKQQEQYPPPEAGHVGFVESSVVQDKTADDDAAAAATTADQPRRPAAWTRPSFRPVMPSLLSNTVFSTPAPPALQQKQPANLSVAYRLHTLRRTSSLPDRLTDQQTSPRAVAAAELKQKPNGGAVNTVDARQKDSEDEGEPEMSRTAAVMLLLISTGLVAFCAELLVDSIPGMIQNTTVSQAFIGLIILPIVGNAAEHVTAVTVATKNKMDLAIGVAVGSSIQIALFVTPFVVLLGWIMGKEMSLYFNLFETISLFVTAFVVNFLVLDGRSNYLEGALLIAAYVIIALAAFYYPNEAQQSMLGGSTGNNSTTAMF